MGEIVERVARAIFDDIRKDSLSSDVERWALVASVGIARAAIAAHEAALAAAGFVIVPRQPTAEMIQDGLSEFTGFRYDYDDERQTVAEIYGYMIEAALSASCASFAPPAARDAAS